MINRTNGNLEYGYLSVNNIFMYEFKKDNRLVSVESVTESYFNKINTYEDDLIKLELEGNLLTEMVKAFENGEKDEFHNFIPLLVGSEYEQTLSHVINKLNELQTLRDKLLLQATTENQRIKSLEHQIEIQKNLFKETLSSIRAQVRSRKKKITQVLKENEQIFNTLPAKELEYARLQRIFNIDEKYFTLLLEKKTEYSISEAGFVSKNNILEDALVNNIPISPQKKVIWYIQVISPIKD